MAMKTKSAVFGILLCGLLAQLAFGQNAPKAMTNSDVVAMAKAGLPEDTIISALGAQETSFDNSAAALVDLVKQGVSAKIIDAMIAASKKSRGAAESAPATPSPAPNANTAVPGAQQFVPAPAPAAPSNQAGQPQGARGNANANANQNANAPQAGGGGFFGRLNQTMHQTQGAIQQGGETARQAQGTVQGLQGTTANQAAGAKAPAAGNAAGQPQPQPRAATPGQAAPNQPRAATPTPAPAGAPPAQDVQALQAQRAAAAERQRQQAQVMQQKMLDCRQQATKIDPQMATPEAQKAYTSCVQAVIQANTPANRPANGQAK
jgi:hypothetical protein